MHITSPTRDHAVAVLHAVKGIGDSRQAILHCQVRTSEGRDWLKGRKYGRGYMPDRDGEIFFQAPSPVRS